MSDTRKIVKSGNERKIYLTIDPNTEGGKYYAQHRDEISDRIMEALTELAEERVNEIKKFRATFLDECNAVYNKLIALCASKTLIATCILHHADSHLKFITKFLKDSDTFPELTAAERVKFLDLASKVAQTSIEDVNAITDLANDWRQKPVAPTNKSVVESIAIAQRQVAVLKDEFLTLHAPVPKHLQSMGYFKEIAKKFLAVEKELENAKTIILRSKCNSENPKEFNALVEKYIKLCMVGNDKYQTDYKDLLAAQKILTAKEKSAQQQTVKKSAPIDIPSLKGVKSTMYQPESELEFEPAPPSTPSPGMRVSPTKG